MLIKAGSFRSAGVICVILQAKLAADEQICFSYLNGQHSVRGCSKPCKFLKQGCPSAHNTLLHGSERFFLQKRREKTEETKKTTTSHVTVVPNKTEESPGMPSVTSVNGLLQITEVNL